MAGYELHDIAKIKDYKTYFIILIFTYLKRFTFIGKLIKQYFSSITQSYDPALREGQQADMAVAIAGASNLRLVILTILK